jgi:hypothetical protein
MSVFTNMLEKLKKDETLIDIYRDEIVDNCLTGIISDYNDLLCYSSIVYEDGTEDGISIVKTKDITRLRWEGNARESLILLMKEKKTTLSKPKLSILTLREAIESVQNHFGYVDIHIEYMNDETCFIGEVEDIDDDHLVLNEFGTMSSRDRHRLLVPLDQISRIDAGDQYEKDIVFLSKNNR